MKEANFNLTILQDLDSEQAYNRAATLFYKSYERKIVNYALQKGLSKAEGMDILWETFCSVVKAIRDERIDPHRNCDGYIWTIVYNNVCTHFRKSKKQVPTLDLDEVVKWANPSQPSYSLHEETTWEETLQVWEQKQAGVLESLKSKEQYLLKEHYFEGKTLEKIAQESGETAASVRQRHSRVLEKLKKMLKRWMPIAVLVYNIHFFYSNFIQVIDYQLFN